MVTIESKNGKAGWAGYLKKRAGWRGILDGFDEINQLLWEG
jgi:hypothetical protein